MFGIFGYRIIKYKFWILVPNNETYIAFQSNFNINKILSLFLKKIKIFHKKQFT